MIISHAVLNFTLQCALDLRMQVAYFHVICWNPRARLYLLLNQMFAWSPVLH